MDSGLLDPRIPEAGAVDQNGQSAYAPNVTTSDNPVRKDVTTREYEYVKTVSAIYEPDESVTKLHIYRSRVNGNCRASTIYDTKGLARAATCCNALIFSIILFCHPPGRLKYMLSLTACATLLTEPG